MSCLLVCVALLVATGLLSAALGRHRVVAHLTGASGVALAASLGLGTALGGLLSDVRSEGVLPWAGFGTLSFLLDPLAALFLIPIWIVGAVAAVYALEYVWHHGEHAPIGKHWFFYNLLLASMAVVVLASNAWTFLLGWELMSLASFFLVTFDHEKSSVREAGWVYLVATHLGTAFLIPMFFYLGSRAGSFEFAAMREVGLDPSAAGLVFVFAVVGFGTKAGFFPLHVWLPEAHPAAPSHVSALLSGVMIKTGVYGLLRTIGFLGTPAAWWGWLLLSIGVISGVLAILFALAQHDVKRLLAYSSVENVGIVTAGTGLGLLGMAHGTYALTVLGFGGALLHIVNHAFFKGLLFLGAGSINQETGTRDLDHLGGLLRRMPWTGVTFLVGATAIAGLPPFNGFVSELLIYLASFRAAGDASASLSGPATVAVAGLALIGGLAAACFVKAFGVMFLGEARTECAQKGGDPGLAMRMAMLLLAVLCAVVGLGAALFVPLLAPAIATLGSMQVSDVAPTLAEAAGTFRWVLVAVLVVGAVLGLLGLVRARLLRGRTVTRSVTWDCGYAAPTARIQYTASSFVEPITRAFSPFLRTHQAAHEPRGYFPKVASLSTVTADLGRERLFGPVFTTIRQTLGRVRWLQRGNVHLYVLYVAAALVALLVWKLQ